MKQYNFVFFFFQGERRTKLSFKHYFEKEQLNKMKIREIKDVLKKNIENKFQIDLSDYNNEDFNLYYEGELLRPSFMLADYKINYKKNIVIILREGFNDIKDIEEISPQYFSELQDPNIKLREINTDLKQQIYKKRKRRFTKLLIYDFILSLTAVFLIFLILKLTRTI